MLSNEFNEKLDHFLHLKKNFDGVFSSDKIPRKIKKDQFFVSNTDSSSGPGIHWYCILKLEKDS